MLLTVEVRTTGGAVVDGARVTMKHEDSGRKHSKYTVAGFCVFDVDAGRYSLSALKEWSLPEPARVAAFDVSAPVTQRMVLDEVKYALHVDANRDGSVDDTPATEVWTWGPGGSGAVILCNMDDDSGSGVMDARDDEIDTDVDKPDVAKLQIRRTGVGDVPNTWTLELSILGTKRRRVRLFEERRGGAKEIVGPNHASYQVPLTPTQELWKFGMEAIEFASQNWKGGATICLEVSKPDYTTRTIVSYQSKARVRVAPWMMPCVEEIPQTIYAVDTTDNDRFLIELDTAVNATTGALVTYGSDDRWMQDCMEVGYSLLPLKGRAHRVDCVIRAYRGDDLYLYPPQLIASEYGVYDPFQGTPFGTPKTTFDSFGNLECTPPVKDSANKEYPWGRIYFGPGDGADDFNPTVAEFLRRQVVQAPIELDTSWLYVGHVDEMMTFLPYPGGAQWKQWKLLIASPQKAYDILADMDGNGLGGQPILEGRVMDFGAGEQSVQNTVNQFLNGDTLIPDPANTGMNFLGPAFQNLNCNVVQSKIDAVLTVLEEKIGLDPVNDVIRVPVIFFPYDILHEKYGALTADMVNMLVLEGLCLVPKPFGPMAPAGGTHPAPWDRFEAYLREQVETRIGVNPQLQYVDDWRTYHMLEGEIHCGTNTRRKPVNLNAWLASDAARWWRFEPF